MRRVFGVIAAVILLAAAPAVAQTGGDPSACAAIAGDTQRLACYDAIFRVNAGPPEGAIVIESRQPIPARPTGRAPALMTIACTDEGVAVSFSFANQLLSETSNEAPISFQVQQTGNVVRNLPVSGNKTSIGFPPGAQSAAFLESIEGGRNLQVRVTPVRQRSQQVVFDFGTQEVAIAALQESCG